MIYNKVIKPYFNLPILRSFKELPYYNWEYSNKKRFI